LRQVRWLVILYPLMAAGFGLLLTLVSRHLSREDVDVYFWQQALYAIGIATFLAGQANFNERKSRRILGVLSKGVTRRDYLAGLLGGVFISSGLCVAGVLVGTLSMAERQQFPVHSVFAAMLLMWISCCLGAAIAMFLSTFLHPSLAVPGALIMIGSGWATELGAFGKLLFPVLQLNIEARGLLAKQQAGLLPIPIAILEILIFWLLAGWIFERRDVAIAIE
jgi:ABC-type transport system involved in multi-copper enzyme maturation permease subunit